MGTLKRTPLRDFHAAHGARLVDFAGWEMPVQYKSILEEHKAVRRDAGLFDVSHMGEVDVKGPAALAFLNAIVTNDVSKLYPGRVLYTPMCDENGGVMDDLLIYMRGAEDFFLCINASNTSKDLAWFQEQKGDFDVEIRDRSSDYALLALQGPNSLQILQPICGPALDLIKYYHFGEGHVAGVDCLISRTGYTGEDGFELYHAAKDAPKLAAALYEVGSAHGLVLAGLGARDSLRLEAGFPLHGHELSDTISPLAAGIGWTVKLGKGVDFVGDQALSSEKAMGSARKVVYFRTGTRRTALAGAVLRTESGAEAGKVLSGAFSPVLNESIGSALIDVFNATASLNVDLGGLIVPITLINPPFVPLRKIT